MLHTFLEEIRSPADTASRLPLIPINDTSRTFAAREYELTNALQATAQSGHWLNGHGRTRNCAAGPVVYTASA